MVRQLTFFVLTCLVVSVLSACDKDQSSKKKAIRPVKIMVVTQSGGMIPRYFPGKVLASKEAELSFLVPGQLIELPVLEGQEVKENDVLAKLDPVRYREAFNEAKANFEKSKAYYFRAKELFRQKYLSAAAYDTHRAKYLSTLSLMNRAKKDLDDTVIVAPFGGVISIKYVENYEHVQAKQKIIKLQDLSNIDVEINVPENVMVNLKKDASKQKQLRVIFDSIPKKTYYSVFKEYSAEADPDTQTYRVILTMPAPKDVNILPGMTATIKAMLPGFKSSGKNFIIIPASAVLSKNGQTFVWLLDTKSMTVTKQAVTVGRMANNDIYVTSGVKPGDRIVTAGVHYLQDGQEISLLKDDERKR